MSQLTVILQYKQNITKKKTNGIEEGKTFEVVNLYSYWFYLHFFQILFYCSIFIA